MLAKTSQHAKIWRRTQLTFHIRIPNSKYSPRLNHNPNHYPNLNPNHNPNPNPSPTPNTYDNASF